jgi:hypothetical protein
MVTTAEAVLSRQGLNVSQLGMLGLIAHGVDCWNSAEATSLIDELHARGLVRPVEAALGRHVNRWVLTATGCVALDAPSDPFFAGWAGFIQRKGSTPREF